MLTQMDETVRTANSKVLYHPFDSPAAVRSSNQVTNGILDFRGRLGIEPGHETTDAKRWGHAVTEVRDRVIASASDAVSVAGRFGADTFDRATEPFRAVDIDGDGVPDKPRATAAAEEAGAAIKGAATGVADAIGTVFKRKAASATTSEGSSPQASTEEP